MEATERILKCLQPILKLDVNAMEQITDELNLYTIGMSSLNHMNFLVSLEDEFGIVFENGELLIDNFLTLGQVKKMILKK